MKIGKAQLNIITITDDIIECEFKRNGEMKTGIIFPDQNTKDLKFGIQTLFIEDLSEKNAFGENYKFRVINIDNYYSFKTDYNNLFIKSAKKFNAKFEKKHYLWMFPIEYKVNAVKLENMFNSDKRKYLVEYGSGHDYELSCLGFPLAKLEYNEIKRNGKYFEIVSGNITGQFINDKPKVIYEDLIIKVDLPYLLVEHYKDKLTELGIISIEETVKDDI